MILVFVGKSSGKTTNAMNVAGELAQRPISRRAKRTRKVRLIDADPQRLSAEWAAHHPGTPLFEVMEFVDPSIHRSISALSDGVDDLVIDAPGGTGQPMPIPDGRIRITRSAILAALCDDHGVVVIPVTPSPLDMWAGDDVISVIEEAWTYEGAAPNARSRTVALLNQAKTTRKGGPGRPDRVSVMVRAARARLENARVNQLRTVIHDRQDFLFSVAAGLTVTEYAPRSVAADEVRALTTELLTLAGENR